MENCGFIYIASGKDYADLAISSATSLKKNGNSHPIYLYTDCALTNPIFDRILSIPTHCHREKISGMIASPFERTVFLDCDTIILSELDELFALLERFDLLISHDVRRSSTLIEQSANPKIPASFCQHNSGVMAFKKSPPMLELLKDWAFRYDQLKNPRDQVTLKDLLWESDVRFWVLPEEWNFRRVTQLDAWEPLDAYPRILHNHQLLRHIREKKPRTDSLADVLEFERLALKQEWRDAFKAIPELKNAPFEKWHQIVMENRHRLSS